MSTQLLSKTEILKRLDGNVGLFFYDTLSSTNDYARKLGERGESFIAVVARGQEKGRGTKGRSFFSKSDEGLFLSFLFQPEKLRERDISLVTPAAAVVTAKAIRDLTGVKVQIKWINDIVYEDKKLCGILCEGGAANSGKPAYIVVGIGINLKVESFPKEIKDTAVSLSSIVNSGFDANELCAKLVNGLYKLFNDFNSFEVLKEYREMSATLKRRIAFSADNQRFEGIAKAINNEGNLVAEANGKEYTLFSSDAEVKLI